MQETLSKMNLRAWSCALAIVACVGLLVVGSLPRDAANADPASPSPEVAAATDSAKALSSAFRAASDKVLPSVVMIRNLPTPMKISKKAPTGEWKKEEITPDGKRHEFEFRGTPFGFKGTPFEDLFKNNPEMKRFFGDIPSMPEMPGGPGAPHGGGGIGSGVIIDAAGLILTNNHVVDGGGKIVVRLQDGREFEAVEIKTDPKTDLAVVRIEGADGLVAAELGNSDEVQVGDWVLALGDPFGLEGTVTAGIISAKGRGIGITARENFLQTDAAINPGNSGGPLVNLDGHVVGINTAISSRSGGNQGVGFAVPVNLAKWVSHQLVSDGIVRRAYLGVMIQPVTHELAQQFNVKTRDGVLVTDVRKDTPAAKAGLKEGDVIVEFNGTKITSPRQLQGVVEQTQIDSSTKMVVVRDGKRTTLNVTVREQPSEYGLAAGMGQQEEASPKAESSTFEKLGLQLEQLTPEVAKHLGLEGHQGLVITEVQPGSPADAAGLKSGMLITQANRKAIGSSEDLGRILAEDDSKDGVLLLVRDRNGARFVVLSFDE